MAETLPMALFAAFMIGLLGSTHCLGMCGGISSSLTMALPVGPGYRWRQLQLLLGYNLGRITSYTLAGLILGLLGSQVISAMPAAGMVLRTLAGGMLIALGLAVGQWWQGVMALEKVGAPLWQRLAPLTRRFMPVDRLSRALPLGLLWGWLPCGLVYSTLGWALMQGNALASAGVMASFGLGTLPAMLATGVFARQVLQLRRNRPVRTVTGLALILFGIWTLPITHHLLAGH
ncbi:MAG: sulfite exporter TauE/SafE family protein [Halomonadaceae bacterium]|nr:MAG: sulfite exporter TauE/SafE family protein [Halomonadaceae bacterium]